MSKLGSDVNGIVAGRRPAIDAASIIADVAGRSGEEEKPAPESAPSGKAAAKPKAATKKKTEAPSKPKRKPKAAQGRVQLNVDITRELHEACRKASFTSGKPVKQIVREALENELKKYDAVK